MQLSEQDKEAFVQYAESTPTKEACALQVLQDGKAVLLFVPNSHHEPEDFFRIDREVLNAHEVLGIIHSHPSSTEQASDADKAACWASKVPWAIYSLTTKNWNFIEPEELTLPLKGRKFVYGVFDCYTLIRDTYWQELGHVLPVFEAPYGFWKRGEEAYLENYKKAGFVDVTDNTLRPYDIILMQYAGNVVNHAGVYRGNGKMLHHTEGKLSCEVPYGGYWLQHTRKIIRHFSLLNKKD